MIESAGTFQPPRFVALDSLRGVAAFSIVAYHVHGGGALFDTPLVRGAWLMVDFFFVLSGFVIAANYGNRIAQGFSLRSFMALRLGRVYPLHIAVLALYVALELGQFLFQPAGWTLREPFTGAHSPGQLALTILMLQGFSAEAAQGWSGQSWSVSVEVWLYLGMALLWRWLGNRAWIAALVLTGLVFAAMVLGYTDGSAIYLYNAMRGVAGFGLGVAVWHLWQWRGVQRKSAIAATLIELSALVLACVAIVWQPGVGWNFVAADAAFALVVLVFAMQAGAVSRLLMTSPFVWGGVLSYSIYLLHPMVLGRGVDILRHMGLGSLTLGGLGPERAIAAPEGWNTVLALLLMAACIPVAWASWRFIEMPAREWSRRRVRPRNGEN